MKPLQRRLLALESRQKPPTLVGVVIRPDDDVDAAMADIERRRAAGENLLILRIRRAPERLPS